MYTFVQFNNVQYRISCCLVLINTEHALDKTVSKKLKMLLISPLENTAQNNCCGFHIPSTQDIALTSS